MGEDEGVSGKNRVSAARRGDSSEDDGDGRSLPQTRGETDHSQEDDEEGRGLPQTKDDTAHLLEDERGESPPRGTPKGATQLSIRGIKVGRLNLSSFRRKREEEKEGKKKPSEGDEVDECDRDEEGVGDDQRGGDTPLSDEEDALTASSATCTELLDGRLLLSGYEFASDGEKVKSKKITHIVNMAGEECPNRFEAPLSYRTYYVRDDLQEDLFYSLLDATHFIEEMLSSDEANKILVHCNKGVSRSVIVVIFFLMTHLGIPFGDAFDLVKRRRPLSNPNLGFVSQLLHLFGLRRRVGGASLESTSDGATPVEPPSGEATLIFRVDGAGEALTLTNLMSLSQDASTNPTEMDQRFNYVMTRDFREFYLLLLDPTFEAACTPLLARFARICRAFFHGGAAEGMHAMHVIHATHAGELMQRLRLDTQLSSRLPRNDGAYRKLLQVREGMSGSWAAQQCSGVAAQQRDESMP
ncbi:protein tyrosine phosphatase, putative [Plasmodium vivax]|uniref:Protein tyrosine phosphatase, putative n=3 Tax=Plasmodium vivax TaxID=5855 RepID=A0A1G4H6G7_PLAVI|nr:mitogen-activated protein (MAP) kinase phosphatase [Plasmodium vivax Brazil I]KNA02495.1 mitogen-activated protein (MAP) kinase phosphatase [Plasmodium vivax North Korean]CAI7717756.1 protein tyrosine phosphatase, putative [Plasmodium vivax]SCO70481.1 protein tyrosine phosphatase, putative [Plasmodium vivax]